MLTYPCVLANRTPHLTNRDEERFFGLQMDQSSDLVCIALHFVVSTDCPRGPTDNDPVPKKKKTIWSLKQTRVSMMIFTYRAQLLGHSTVEYQ